MDVDLRLVFSGPLLKRADEVGQRGFLLVPFCLQIIGARMSAVRTAALFLLGGIGLRLVLHDLVALDLATGLSLVRRDWAQALQIRSRDHVREEFSEVCPLRRISERAVVQFEWLRKGGLRWVSCVL